MKGPYPLVAPSDVAVRSYRLLLLCYPPQFRKEFGGAMTLLFRDCLRDARNENEQAVLQLWLSTLFDIGVSAPRAHLEEWSAMQASYTRSSQVGAICAFVAAILWAIVFGVGDTYSTFGMGVANMLILGAIVVTLGTIGGLYLRLNATQRSPFAVAGVAIGTLALVIILVSIVGWYLNPENEWGWYAFMSSIAFLALALGLLGVSASTQASLGPLRFAPLLTLGMPILIFVILFFYSTLGGEMSNGLEGVAGGLALLGILGTGALLWTKSK